MATYFSTVPLPATALKTGHKRRSEHLKQATYPLPAGAMSNAIKDVVKASPTPISFGEVVEYGPTMSLIHFPPTNGY